MLPIRHRLPLRHLPDFFSEAQRIGGKHLLVMVRQVGVEENSRGAVVVSKKVSAQAVQRNKLRRQLRQLLLENLMQQPGLEVVMVAKPGILNLDFTELTQESNALWKRLLNSIKH